MIMKVKCLNPGAEPPAEKKASQQLGTFGERLKSARDDGQV